MRSSIRPHDSTQTTQRISVQLNVSVLENAFLLHGAQFCREANIGSYN